MRRLLPVSPDRSHQPRRRFGRPARRSFIRLGQIITVGPDAGARAPAENAAGPDVNAPPASRLTRARSRRAESDPRLEQPATDASERRFPVWSAEPQSATPAHPGNHAVPVRLAAPCTKRPVGWMAPGLPLASGCETSGRLWGAPGGLPPDRYCEPLVRGPQAPDHGATPGGYGGKPPGVAFIGAPTGARNAGNWCPSGGPEHR